MQIVDVAPVAMAAPADDIGLKPIAQLRRNVEESRTVGREQPLVSMHREHIGLNVGGIEAQCADALGPVDKQQDAPRAQKLGQFGQRRREAGVVIHRAQDDEARPWSHRFVEPIPGTGSCFHAQAVEKAGGVKIVRKFVFQSEHVIAGMPVEPREQQAQRSGCIRNERDILRRAIDQPADLSRECDRHRHTRRENPRTPVHRDERSVEQRLRWRGAAIARTSRC